MIRIFKVFVPASIIVLILSEVFLVASCYVAAALVISDIEPEVFLFYDAGMWRILAVVALVILCFYFMDLYDDLRIRSRLLLVQQVCMAVGVAFIGQALLSYANPTWILPRWMMIGGSGLVLLLIPPWRLLYSFFVLRAMNNQRVMLFGDSVALDELAQRLADRPELGLQAIGYVSDYPRGAESEMPETVPHLGHLTEFRQIVTAVKPNSIVIGMAERRQRLPFQELLVMRFTGIQVLEVANLYETCFGRVCTRELRPSQLIFSESLGPNPASVSLQAVYCFLFALVGLVVFAPVMLIVAALVRVTSPGPILYRQRRVGMNSKVFTVFKFRTMYQDAEARTGAVWATKNDPRITPLGRFLRKSRLDELPQLFNVLRGEMAIAGPRPERPEFVKTLEEQIPFYRQRHFVKPGITGWAQINYKYGDTLEDTINKLEYDLYYIKHLSMQLDLYIFFHTIKTMLLSRGAQ